MDQEALGSKTSIEELYDELMPVKVFYAIRKERRGLAGKFRAQNTMGCSEAVNTPGKMPSGAWQY
jgi:hypothetical protein